MTGDLSLWLAVLALACGGALGVAHTALLALSLRGGQLRPGRVALGVVIRLALAVAVFVPFARLGALPVLVALAGFLAGRALARRRVLGRRGFGGL